MLRTANDKSDAIKKQASSTLKLFLLSQRTRVAKMDATSSSKEVEIKLVIESYRNISHEMIHRRGNMLITYYPL